MSTKQFLIQLLIILITVLGSTFFLIHGRFFKMDWTQIAISIAPVATLILGNAAFIIPLFLWNRSESRADYRHLETGVNAQLTAIQAEIKDFHGKLCAIEERGKSK